VNDTDWRVYPMARPAKPWFRASRNAWYVEINGHQHNLGSDEAEATRRFHEILARPAERESPPTPVPTVAELFEKFLSWCSIHRAPATYEYSRSRLQMFIDAKPALVRMQVTTFKPFHVVEWIDAQSSAQTARYSLLETGTRQLACLMSPLGSYFIRLDGRCPTT
jgi:hypothetical protein